MSLTCFKPNFNIEILDNEQVVLFSEDRHHLLKGSIYVAIAEIIRFTPLSEQDIIDNLSRKFPVELTKEALRRLKTKNFTVKNCNKTPKNITGFWSDLLLENPNKEGFAIVVKNFSKHSSSELVNALKNLSLEVAEFGGFFVVIVDNYICGELADFNEARLKDGTPWMLLKPSGSTIWIGPIFEPNRTGCWNCLVEKLKENRRVEVDLFGLKDTDLNIPSICHLPTTLNIAMNLAANEVAKWERSDQPHKL